MYMLCNTHNPEMNKILYSWFVNLFLVYLFKYTFFLYDVKIELFPKNIPYTHALE